MKHKLIIDLHCKYLDTKENLIKVLQALPNDAVDFDFEFATHDKNILYLGFHSSSLNDSGPRVFSVEEQKSFVLVKRSIK